MSVTCGSWFSRYTPVSCTNKTDRHNITEILLKVALNTITLTCISVPNRLYGVDVSSVFLLLLIDEFYYQNMSLMTKECSNLRKYAVYEWIAILFGHEGHNFYNEIR